MTVRQFRRLEIGLWRIGNPITVLVWYPRYFGSQIRRLQYQGSAEILREYFSAGTEFYGQTLTCPKGFSYMRNIPNAWKRMWSAGVKLWNGNPQTWTKWSRVTTWSGLFSNLYNVKKSWLVTTFATTVAWFQTAWFNFPSPKSPGLVNLTDYTSFIYKTTQSSKIPII